MMGASSLNIVIIIIIIIINFCKHASRSCASYS